MADWFYFQGGNQKGPVSDDQLRGMVSSGQLSPGDSVWKQGMANWAPISSIPELSGGGGPPGPGPGGPPGRGPDQDYEDDYARRPAPSAGGAKKITLWAILLVSGAGLWLINSFLPWWGMELKEPVSPEDRKAAQDAARIFKDNSSWYSSHLSTDHHRNFTRVFTDPDKSSHSATLLGIQTGTGLFGMIMSILILGAVITSFFVGILADWRWTGDFLFALIGLILLIFGFVWLFGAPGADSPPILSQGISIGPIVHLVATLLVLTGSILDGLFGLFGFLARLKGRA